MARVVGLWRRSRLLSAFHSVSLQGPQIHFYCRVAWALMLPQKDLFPYLLPPVQFHHTCTYFLGELSRVSLEHMCVLGRVLHDSGLLLVIFSWDQHCSSLLPTIHWKDSIQVEFCTPWTGECPLQGQDDSFLVLTHRWGPSPGLAWH